MIYSRSLHALHSQIYVEQALIDFYRELSEQKLADSLCSNSEDTWIHVCSRKKHIHGARRFRKTCQPISSNGHQRNFTQVQNDPSNLPASDGASAHKLAIPTLIILPTAVWFGLSNHVLRSRGFAFIPSANSYEKIVRLLYCTHSSYSELTEFVQHLRPQKAFACSIPPKDTKYAVQSRLDAIVKEAHLSTACPVAGKPLLEDPRERISENRSLMEAVLNFTEHSRQARAVRWKEDEQHDDFSF